MKILKKKLITVLRKLFLPFMIPMLSEPTIRKGKTNSYYLVKVTKHNCLEGNNVRCEFPFDLRDLTIGDYTYISMNARISLAEIGKFCSIGPNFFCGGGIHPTNGISTSPAFYSTKMQLGITFSEIDKIEERKKISIGNDVFIGANVTVLDGVTIGNGSVIGAGAVVSKDIPPYAIAVGSPIRIIKYRFDEETINNLLKIEWWNFNEDQLKNLEKYFFQINTFIEKNLNETRS
jgi:virginiamycin A acetyltransferase